MTGAFLLLALAAAPTPARTAPLSIVVQSVRGESRIPVLLDALSGPVLPAPALLTALGASAVRGEGWAEVVIGARSFRFLLGAPLYALEGKVRPLAGSAALLALVFMYVAQDRDAIVSAEDTAKAPDKG